MTTLTVIDLFCGAGGAAMGIHDACCAAGIDVEIIGIDNRPQPRYPFTFICASWDEIDLQGVDFIWASPPCQRYTDLNQMYNAKKHPELIPAVRAQLQSSGATYVIENVPRAPIRNDLLLCGTMFDLWTENAELRRHRIFEMSFKPTQIPRCSHGLFERVIGVYGGHGRDRRRKVNGRDFSTMQRREAMGISWMTTTELSQAVPPAYSHFIFIEWLKATVTAPSSLSPAPRLAR